MTRCILLLTLLGVTLLLGCGSEPDGRADPGERAAELATTAPTGLLPSSSPASPRMAGTQLERDGDRVQGLVDVGGYRLYIECRGTGSPTVVLDAGAGGSSSVWSRVARVVATNTRVCAYDRARRGKSDPGIVPNDAARMVSDLHALLIGADITGPYVLVGQSFGGLVAQLFASTYPSEVAGLVLVDSAHATYYRLLNLPRTEVDYRLSAEQVEQARAWPLVPVVVLSRGRPFPQAGISEDDWAAGQADLASRIPATVHTVVADAGHNIHFDRPDAVVEAIHAAVQAATR